MLTDQQEEFCNHYILYHNATKSAALSGYSKHTAHVQGSRLLSKPEIKERIKALQDEAEPDYLVRYHTVEEIEKQYYNAKRNGNITVALKALELLSKCKKVETEPQRHSNDGDDTELIRCLKVIGKEAVFNLCRRAEFDISDWEENLKNGLTIDGQPQTS